MVCGCTYEAQMEKLILLLALLPSFAFAVPSALESGLSWTAPDTYETGEILPPAEIGGYWLYLRGTNGTFSDTLRFSVTDTSLNYVGINAPDGKYIAAITAFDINGIESTYSPEVSIQIVKKRLSAPRNIVKQ